MLKVILQRMNNEVFEKPVELMENIINVTSYLKERIEEKRGRPGAGDAECDPGKGRKALLQG